MMARILYQIRPQYRVGSAFEAESLLTNLYNEYVRGHDHLNPSLVSISLESQSVMVLIDDTGNSADQTQATHQAMIGFHNYTVEARQVVVSYVN